MQRAVCGDPDDNTARLVYADAAEEAGDAKHAQFTRDQVSREVADPSERRRLREKFRGKPERRYRQTLRAEIAPEVSKKAQTAIVFGRGFVDVVNWQIPFSTYGDNQLGNEDAMSLLRWLVADNEQLRTIRALNLFRFLRNAFYPLHPGQEQSVDCYAQALLGNEHLKNVRDMNLSENPVFDENDTNFIVDALVDNAQNLEKLEKLNLSYNQLTRRSIEPLVEALERGAFPRLKYVQIEDQPYLSDMCNDAIGRRPNFQALVAPKGENGNELPGK
jgi:uncharacterized protein (TIGR02996 family)